MRTSTLIETSTEFCPFPIHSVMTSVTRTHCAQLCLTTPGCQSFNFRPVGGSTSHGDCVIVAPSSGPQPTIPGVEEPGWTHYANMGV